MAYAVAFEDVKTKVLKRKNPEHKGYKLALLGSKENPELPHATYNQHEPGVYFNSAHFHSSDQFQVTIEGKFKIGRHELTPYCVHFTRAYTPYGPLVSEGTPFTFVVMRTHLDEGSQHLPQQMGKLQQATQRQPWQITRKVSVPQFGANASTDILLRPIPDIVDEQGLAAYTLNMKPHAVADAPDPAIGDGQYLVVVKGSLIHEGTEKKAFALIFVRPQEGPYRIHAGAEGLEAIVLNFPQVKTRAAYSPQPSRAPGFKKWQCELCSFAYDEALGLPDEGIAPGTRWEDIPDTWSCPDCSTSKSDFRMVEV